jgi:hypothetical protein
MQDALSLIPGWLPAHLFWTYFTGCTFVAAGVATSQASMPGWRQRCRPGKSRYFCFSPGYLLCLMAPKISSSGAKRFLNAALGAAAFVVADSYRDAPWLAIHNKS